MRSSHGPHNECFCIVLIVSGALLTEVNNNRSLSGDNLLVVNKLQSSK
ncbi:small toxic inner membrane protein TimP [Escherichia coli]|nr:small toxic inner membrane protein TimP [Escherichia coli]